MLSSILRRQLPPPLLPSVFKQLNAFVSSSVSSEVVIFDGVLKAAHRDRGSLYPPTPDPLTDEVASRLVERLGDCTRSFPSILVLGGAGLQVLRQLQRLQNNNHGGGSSSKSIESVTLVDTSFGMIERAKREFPPSPATTATDPPSSSTSMKIIYIHADPSAEILPVEPDSYDAVISCLGLHWVNDVPGVLLQCRFALRPDGLFLGAMFGGATLQELRIACTVGQQEREGGVAPRTSPLAQVRDAGNLLTRAGLAIPTVDVDDITVQYGSVVQLVEHVRRMGEGNALVQRREALPRDTALASAAIYTSLFVGGVSEGDDGGGGGNARGGGVPATFEVVYLTGWAPDPSQPRSAKRGSGTVTFGQLSDALGGAPKET